MDLPPATIDFDCGVVATNVGEISMALTHHLTICKDQACRDDVTAELARIRG